MIMINGLRLLLFFVVLFYSYDEKFADARMHEDLVGLDEYLDEKDYPAFSKLLGPDDKVGDIQKLKEKLTEIHDETARKRYVRENNKTESAVTGQIKAKTNGKAEKPEQQKEETKSNGLTEKIPTAHKIKLTRKIVKKGKTVLLKRPIKTHPVGNWKTNEYVSRVKVTRRTNNTYPEQGQKTWRKNTDKRPTADEIKASRKHVKKSKTVLLKRPIKTHPVGNWKTNEYVSRGGTQKYSRIKASRKPINKGKMKKAKTPIKTHPVRNWAAGEYGSKVKGSERTNHTYLEQEGQKTESVSTGKGPTAGEMKASQKPIPVNEEKIMSVELPTKTHPFGTWEAYKSAKQKKAKKRKQNKKEKDRQLIQSLKQLVSASVLEQLQKAGKSKLVLVKPQMARSSFMTDNFFWIGIGVGGIFCILISILCCCYLEQIRSHFVGLKGEKSVIQPADSNDKTQIQQSEVKEKNGKKVRSHAKISLVSKEDEKKQEWSSEEEEVFNASVVKGNKESSSKVDQQTAEKTNLATRSTPPASSSSLPKSTPETTARSASIHSEADE